MMKQLIPEQTYATRSRHERVRGYTLLELMVVVAIVGIIAAIAFPSYQSSVKKAKRSDGKSALLSAMQAQERFFAENLTYTTDMTDIGYSSVSPKSSEGYYTLSASTCEDEDGTDLGLTLRECVMITADGDASTDGDMTFDSLGAKYPSDLW